MTLLVFFIFWVRNWFDFEIDEEKSSICLFLCDPSLFGIVLFAPTSLVIRDLKVKGFLTFS